MKILKEFSENRGEEINISPLIDIVFILLIFFVATMVFSEKSAMEIQKPESSKTISAPEKSLKIFVNSLGEISLEGVKMDMDSLKNALSFKAENNAVIEADSSVALAKIVEIMDFCKQSGIDKVYISCKQKEGAK